MFLARSFGICKEGKAPNKTLSVFQLSEQREKWEGGLRKECGGIFGSLNAWK